MQGCIISYVVRPMHVADVCGRGRQLALTGAPAGAGAEREVHAGLYGFLCTINANLQLRVLPWLAVGAHWCAEQACWQPGMSCVGLMVASTSHAAVAVFMSLRLGTA
jgi:hypothetical protein